MMGVVWWLVAQTNSDPISTASGWTGAGLLGLVLGVLFFKILPEKDKQIVDVVEKQTQTIKELVAAFRTEVREQREDQERERELCRKNFESLAKSIEALAVSLNSKQRAP